MHLIQKNHAGKGKKGKVKQSYKIPTTLKIGAQTYAINPVQAQGLSERACGTIDYYTQGIVLDIGSNPGWVLITLIHEILHGLNPERTEMDVEQIAQGIAQVLVDNPDLVHSIETIVSLVQQNNKRLTK